MQLSFRYRFEAAHRLTSAQSAHCQTPHGHTWHVTLYFQPINEQLNNENVLDPFQELKSLWKKFIQQEFDHSFIHNAEDPIISTLQEFIPGFRGFPVPGDPTTEMLAVLLLKKARTLHENHFLGLAVQPVALKLEETEVNSVKIDIESAIYKNTLADLIQGGWWDDSDPGSRRFG